MFSILLQPLAHGTCDPRTFSNNLRSHFFLQCFSISDRLICSDLRKERDAAAALSVILYNRDLYDFPLFFT